MSDDTNLLVRPPCTDTQTFCRDPNDAKRLNELRGAAARARRDAVDARKDADRPRANQVKKTAARRAEEAADAADQAIDDFLASVPTITFHLRSVSPDALEELAADHLPDPKQIEKYEVEREAENERLAAAGKRERIGPLTYNPDTYPPALIALLTEKVVVTGEGGGEMTDLTPEVVTEGITKNPGWSPTDQAMLMMACQALSQTSSGISRDLVDRLGNG